MVSNNYRPFQGDSSVLAISVACFHILVSALSLPKKNPGFMFLELNFFAITSEILIK